MKTFLLLLFTGLSIINLNGQGTHKVKLYDSWYNLGQNNNKVRPDFQVYTYEVSDSSVTVIAIDRYLHGINLGQDDYNVISVKDINTIQFRRKGSKTIGVVIGLTGVVIGAVIGLASDTDPALLPLATVACAAVVGGIGFGVGLPLSSVKKTFRIRGDVTKYRENRLEMIPYTIKYYTQ